MKRISAFTLSEVLVTLGIIGVVAALTIPNLVKNYQKQAMTVQLRKTTSEIENAVDMLITEEGKSSLAYTSLARANGVSNFFTNHFKVIKTCSSSNTNKCFASDNYASIDGTQNRAFSCSGTSYVLANSATICANKIDKIAIEARQNGIPISGAFHAVTGLNVELYIDTNGSQPPNIGGRDMFRVYIRPDGTIADTAATDDSNVCTLNKRNQPVCVAGDDFEIRPNANCTASAFGIGCYAELLDNNWQMNY